MTPTYLQLQRQIETLQRQAEKLKAREVSGVVERIKVAIGHYGLTAEQLGFGALKPQSRKPAKSGTPSSTKESIPPKYSDGEGNAWSGRGPRPQWLRDALAAGEALERFASDSPPPASRKLGSKASAKRTTQQYRDDRGNMWGGFGPRPRWLKEALNSGAPLEQFAISNTAR